MASHNYIGSLETCLQTGDALLKGVCLRRSTAAYQC